MSSVKPDLVLATGLVRATGFCARVGLFSWYIAVGV